MWTWDRESRESISFLILHGAMWHACTAASLCVWEANSLTWAPVNSPDTMGMASLLFMEHLMPATFQSRQKSVQRADLLRRDKHRGGCRCSSKMQKARVQIATSGADVGDQGFISGPVAESFCDCGHPLIVSGFIGKRGLILPFPDLLPALSALWALAWVCKHTA